MPTDLLIEAKKIDKNKQARLAHFASHPLPAPSKFPTLTAEAIPNAAGTWKNVDVVERRTDWAARLTGPSNDAARAHASHAHHSDDTYTVSYRLSVNDREANHDSSG